MNRKIQYWKLRTLELQLGEKTMIMGVLNVTPDSFSDGGRYSDPDRAYARALELEEQGADIIDIGAESTSPGSQRISAEEEWRRLAPVLKKLRDKLTVPLSLDTYKAEIAERAFEYGIEIVNDPSGLTFDGELAKTVSNANAGLILNHMRGTPETWAKLPPLPDMTGSIVRDLEAMVNRARRAGIERNRIAVDPGLGFGKRKEQNSEVLAHLRQLATLECPILVGASRKSFLAQATETETLFATAAAVTASILNGAHMVRVHDVKEMKAAALIADEIVRAANASAEAAEIARAAVERPVPRRSAREREEDEKPRSLKPPVAKKAPRVEVVEALAEPEKVAAAPATEISDADVPVDTDFVDVPVIEDAPVKAAPERSVPIRPARVARPDGDRPPRRDFGDRPPKRDFGDRPPRRDFAAGGPPKRDYGSKAPSGDRPPRRDFGDRPPRRDFAAGGPPKRDYGSKPPSGDRPPRRDFGDRPPRRDFAAGGPPKRDYGSKAPSGDRPPRRDSAGGPPRRDFGSRPPSGDRPPRRDFGDRPPRRDSAGGPPPRRDFGSRPPSGDRPPRRDFGDRPPRRDGGAGPSRGPGGGAGTPKRPFRKRP